MKTKWWWNESFEGLMKELSGWIGDKPSIQIQHTDWKYAQPSGKTMGYWYFLMIYKE